MKGVKGEEELFDLKKDGIVILLHYHVLHPRQG